MVDKLAPMWFSEVSEDVCKGQAMSLRYTDILFDERSKYQHVQVLQTETYGKMLVLDGMIQLTERDEFAYHEMLSNLPICSHPNPRAVCVVGGGDGGIVREICRHKEIERVVLCEIDELVIETSKRFFPAVATALVNDPRVTIYIGDGAKFINEHPGEFDIIITDSSDPVGPAEVLFKKPYYEGLRDALRADGIIATQGESIWLHLDLIKDMMVFTRQLFPVSEYAYITIPTYPCGQIGFVIASKGGSCSEPRKEHKDPELKYYSPDVHRAAFILPAFAQKAIDDAS